MTTTTTSISKPEFVSNTYNIKTSNDLLWLIAKSSTDTGFSSDTEQRTIKLINDIDMKNQTIDASTMNLTNMIFDGNNKTITNLNISIFINIIDDRSTLKNIIFKDYTCDYLIVYNGGKITDCKFKNAKCTNSALVRQNYGEIFKCAFDNIEITNTIPSSEMNKYLGVVSIHNSNTISKCNVKNIKINATTGSEFYAGGICGSMINSLVLECSVDNINTNTNSIVFGGICGLVLSGSIEKCNISNILNKSIAVIIGKLNENGEININCLTFRTNKDDKEDKITDLKYNRKTENERRKSGINTRANTTTTGATTTTAGATTTTTGATTTTAGATTTTTGAPSRKMINTIERNSTVTMKNIYKYSSENKMSKWDYEGIIFDDTNCLLELPKINLKKRINDSDVDKLKKHIKDIVKNNSLLDVDITTKVMEEETLGIIISDTPNITIAATTTTSGAEHFENSYVAIVYVYNTSNNLAIMDALNDAPSDPSDFLLGDTTSESSSNLYMYLILIVLVCLITVGILKISKVI
jgi:hypothetical protein